jgi:hypothetical protein
MLHPLSTIEAAIITLKNTYIADRISLSLHAPSSLHSSPVLNSIRGRGIPDKAIPLVISPSSLMALSVAHDPPAFLGIAFGLFQRTLA